MADQKITELNELITPTSSDLLAIVDDPLGSPETKKITYGNIELNINHVNIKNIGTNAHSVIDTHIADNTIHYINPGFLTSETSHADVLVDGDIGVNVLAYRTFGTAANSATTDFEAANANIQSHISDNSQAHSDYLLNTGDTATGNYVITGTMQANAFAGTVNSGEGLHIFSPGGAKYATLTSPVTGAIKITLPQTWTSTMMRMKVDVYEYAPSESFTVYLGGYNYLPGTAWYNTFAQIIAGKLSRNFTVRFGHDGNKCVIYIGELASTWAYPQVVVNEFYAGHSNYELDKWDDGWDISFEASAFGTITKTESNNLVSPWITSGNDIYNLNSGKVGIGTAAPGTALDVNGIITATGGTSTAWNAKSGVSVANQSNNRVVTATATTDALNAEANLVFDGTNLGIGTTTPRALLDISTGFLVGTGLQLPHVVKKVVSANVRNSHDAITFTASTSYVKLKTITLTNGLVGQQRIMFDLLSESGVGNAYGRVYRNGAVLGAEFITKSTTYVTESADITQTWNPGDTCELWGKTVAGETAYLQNFRIAYDDSPTVAVASANS